MSRFTSSYHNKILWTPHSLQLNETWIMKVKDMYIVVWIESSTWEFLCCTPASENCGNFPFSWKLLLNISEAKTSFWLCSCLIYAAALTNNHYSKQISDTTVSPDSREIWFKDQIIPVPASRKMALTRKIRQHPSFLYPIGKQT